VEPSTGNVFVVNRGNNRIQVFDSSGTFITRFGSFGPGNGQIAAAWGIAVNPLTGNVYVADQSNHRIQVFALDP
jgi:tripartite motif-containing protein 71